jgi:hypothetical protein
MIKVFIGDRTMGNLESIVRNRYTKGGILIGFYRMLSCRWHANNSDGFLENTGCYKINSFDEDDDVVDIYSSHHHEVARVHSTVDYSTSQWNKFYESLKFLFKIEQDLHETEVVAAHLERKNFLILKLMQQVDQAESILEGRALN